MRGAAWLNGSGRTSNGGSVKFGNWYSCLSSIMSGLNPTFAEDIYLESELFKSIYHDDQIGYPLLKQFVQKHDYFKIKLKATIVMESDFDKYIQSTRTDLTGRPYIFAFADNALLYTKPTLIYKALTLSKEYMLVGMLVSNYNITSLSKQKNFSIIALKTSVYVSNIKFVNSDPLSTTSYILSSTGELSSDANDGYRYNINRGYRLYIYKQKESTTEVRDPEYRKHIIAPTRSMDISHYGTSENDKTNSNGRSILPTLAYGNIFIRFLIHAIKLPHFCVRYKNIGDMVFTYVMMVKKNDRVHIHILNGGISRYFVISTMAFLMHTVILSYLNSITPKPLEFKSINVQPIFIETDKLKCK
jgi:hypothetical protein